MQINGTENNTASMETGRIVCVEDSPTQAARLKYILETKGYDVTMADSGYGSLDAVRESEPDLVILDVVLPDIDGYEVCRLLRKQFAAYIPVLMLSSRRELEDRLGGLDVGADDYLPKPFDERELLARINSLLRIKRLNDELQERLSEAQESFTVWKQVAITDHLTGLHNRHYLEKMLQEEFEVASRYQRPLSLIMLDIDHFRDFNNRYGHLVGDQVLKGLGGLLGRDSRRSDVIARYGGEEFVLLLPMTDLQSASIRALRICQSVAANMFESEKGPLKVTVSLGAAAIPDPGIITPKELVAKADRALYMAKERGRNRVILLGQGGSEPVELV